MDFFKKIFRSHSRSQHNPDVESHEEVRMVSSSVEDNLAYIRESLFHTEDLKTRQLSYHGRSGALVYLNTMADFAKIQDGILKPMALNEGKKPLEEVIASPQVETEEELDPAVEQLLHGHIILLFEGLKECYVAQAHAIHRRPVSEPDTEKVLRGPHEGFVENLLVNLHLVRKRLDNQQLKVRYFTVGRKNKAKLAVLYIHDLANPEVVEEVEQRLQFIRADSVLSPGYVQEYLEGKVYSPFPQMLSTERPDRVMGNIMEGRVAIIMEGSPTALIVPVTFTAFYQSTDDYSMRPIIGSFFRLIRFISFFISILLPSFYIAVVSFHYEVIPSELVFPMKSSVEIVPFPPILEALLLEITVELIREGGIRLPSPVGQTIGIVGGLVIGESAVRAGLVSNTMVIVVALTAIASFVVPTNEMGASIRILRFPMMLLASLFGFLGIMFGSLLLLIHLTRLESFGTPFFAPAIPLRLRDMKDTIIRLAMWQLNERPADAKPQKWRQEHHSRGWKRDDPEEN
ncbi:spore germination protein [Desmospora profundinema]|uniref:Spore germination protein KA n=1 Tax=Desmospora profundinema TaxID=1571184 RepID=A0ABU1IIW1_9BACL|nr:spore germination protein [Desmospora profundinema]MDR6224343.1 spore germination protein KA [Desmospora profundinema]